MSMPLVTTMDRVRERESLMCSWRGHEFHLQTEVVCRRRTPPPVEILCWIEDVERREEK